MFEPSTSQSQPHQLQEIKLCGLDLYALVNFKLNTAMLIDAQNNKLLSTPEVLAPMGTWLDRQTKEPVTFPTTNLPPAIVIAGGSPLGT